MPARAQRFAMSATVRFRPPGHGDWSQGSTLNISRTGLLFLSDAPAPVPGSRLEFILALPVFAPTPTVEVHCTGQVARVVTAGEPGVKSAVAATIEGYRFLPGAGTETAGH